MALNLYRRHFRIAGKCLGGHAADSRNYEPDELRRAWKKCHCPIYADGTLSGAFRRRNTKQSNWAEARTISAAWEAAGQWDAPVEPVAAPKSDPVPKAKPDGPPTIEFATDAHHSNPWASAVPTRVYQCGSIAAPGSGLLSALLSFGTALHPHEREHLADL
jgi:hypothetical protein